MTFRNHTPTLLTFAMLTACAPAHADAFPDSLPSGPARPGWRPPATRPHVPGAGVDYDFDPGRGPLLDAHAEDNLWLVSPGTWGAGASAVQVSTGPVVTQRPCQPLPQPVPGPLPIAGLGAAFAYSRKLRQRIK